MPATRQSWKNLQPLPARRAKLSLQRAFSEPEIERIRLGLVPERMEDKWFIFLEQDTLYIHRSWTGFCIYQLQFVKQGNRYRTGEAFVNRDEAEYGSSSDPYDEKLLLYLIDHLLLGKRSRLPMPEGVTAGIATELHHSHVLGAGQRAPTGPIQVTLRAVLGWLWRWLLGLVRR